MTPATSEFGALLERLGADPKAMGPEAKSQQFTEPAPDASESERPPRVGPTAGERALLAGGAGCLVLAGLLGVLVVSGTFEDDGRTNVQGDLRRGEEALSGRRVDLDAPQVAASEAKTQPAFGRVEGRPQDVPELFQQ